MDDEKIFDDEKIYKEVLAIKPVLWINKDLEPADEALRELSIKYADMLDARNRLERFRPLIKRLYPEVENGVIESSLVPAPDMKTLLEKRYGRKIHGRLFVKCDSHLQIAGSVKARGGIYEVLKHAEDVALANGILSGSDNYARLADADAKKLFSKHSIAVGSTGNLGLSVGIMGASLGFRSVIHMSRDAKEWKKKLLRDMGAVVIEHEGDYGKAVMEGRNECRKAQNAYFVDDERSKELFLGYSVAALRLREQLERDGIRVDKEHPLYVYLPCGCGGAPGGITFGLKQLFKDNVHAYFVEPTHSPCMLLALMTKKYYGLSVGDYGIDNRTEADGLAVGTPSEIVPLLVNKLVEGEYTIEDEELFKLLVLLKDSEGIRIEPSAASCLYGPCLLGECGENAVHLCWTTGGALLPDGEYAGYYEKGRTLWENSCRKTGKGGIKIAADDNR